MFLRVALFFMMAVGLLGLGAVAWTSVRPNGGITAAEAAAANAKLPTLPHTVLVSAAPLHAGDLLKPENIVAKALKPSEVDLEGSSQDTVDARAAFVGAMLKRSIGKDEPLRAQDVMRPTEHGFLAAVVGQGMSAVSIGVDAISGTAGLISPGDRVDVLLTQTVEDPTIPLGRRISVETVLTNARVVAIDQQIVLGDASRTNSADAQRTHTVTLESTSAAAQRLTVAARIGKLSLTVRSADLVAGGAQQGISEPVFASDVSHAFAVPTPAPPKPMAPLLRIYPGTGETREFRF